MNAPIFPTVLASCVKKPASTVFHPTLCLSQFLKQAEIIFVPITNAKKDRTSFAATYFKEREQGTSGTPFSSFSHGVSSELSV